MEASDSCSGSGDFGRGLKGKHNSLRTGSLKPKGDVIGDLTLIQRLKVEVRRNSLSELVQLRPKQQFPQLGLADNDELQNLVLIGIDV